MKSDFDVLSADQVCLYVVFVVFSLGVDASWRSIVVSYVKLPVKLYHKCECIEGKIWIFQVNRPIRLTQCCTQFKSFGVKILCVLHLQDNVTFIWKYLEQNVPKGSELGTSLS